MIIKTSADLAAACKDLAKNHKTLYVMGCIGAPMTEANKKRYIAHHTYNQSDSRKKKINAASEETFGFDCVCMIKSLLWGWNGNKNRTYGGAVYASNGVPDINANGMISICKDVSSDFSTLQIGEVVWMDGHIGVYIGGGLAVECTPKWKDCVQITAVHNIGKKTGYNGRRWTKHGKLPYLKYAEETAHKTADQAKPSQGKNLNEIAREVISGKWGNGEERKQKLTAAGYNYRAVQNRVNELMK